MIYKILRSLVQRLDSLRSRILTTYYCFIYPRCKIKGTYLAKGVKIFCSDNSTMEISNCYVKTGSKIVADHGGTVVIKDTHIGENCIIVAREKIKISADCQIAEMVVIRDQNHNFGSVGLTIKEQGFIAEPIFIGKNVWLAAKVSVMPGSIIEDNTVVGAHSLVRGKLQANSLYVGTPVRLIRTFT